LEGKCIDLRRAGRRTLQSAIPERLDETGVDDRTGRDEDR